MRAAGIALYLIANLFVLNAMPVWVGGNLLLRIILALLITFVTTLAHELGHALAARWMGAEVRTIMVVPLRLQLRPRRFRLAGPAGHGDIGGYVTYTLDRIGARRKQALIAAAGPAANLLLAVLVTLLGPLSFAMGRGSFGWFGTLASFSVLMAIYNLIPFPGSDGQHILESFRKPRWRR
jgi:Zn-dependent protease